MSELRLGLAQLNPTVGDLLGNSQKILQAAKNCAFQEVSLLITPELSLCGYPPQDLLLDPLFVENCQTALHHLALRIPPKIGVLVGTIFPNSDWWQTGEKPLFNGAALLLDGRIRYTFYKQLLPDYDVFDEHRYFQPGAQVNLLRWQGVRFGVTICEDLWNDEQFWSGKRYPQNPVPALIERGIDILINMSASPYWQGKSALRESLLGHCARQYQVPVIYVNQVGATDQLIFDGRNLIFDAGGQVMHRGRGFTQEVQTVTYDQGQWQNTRLQNPPEPWAEVGQALGLGIRDYVHKSGFQRVVLGLSGGIDSAVVAALAVQALGAEQVLGVLMPSPYSSAHSVTDALALAANLGIKTEKIPIQNLMETYAASLNPLFQGYASDVTEENIQSRIRGDLLMALANKFQALVLATGNKSELAVGYCTLYGDMCGALAPLGDLFKTQVYALARWYNEYTQLRGETALIPAHILTKAPSAELKPGQTDQDSLPPYAVLDDILHRWLSERQTPAQIAQAGHDPVLIERVFQLVQRAEFKRFQAAPVLKISERGFDRGWRVPNVAQPPRHNLPLNP
ncbi:NAD synthetase [Gloeomargarita lithophora Alchichica-D10]|uniref:Glutamine-dependent NAD(+) synthetase n=1 Tax=Gloeomargarita lithophora Alchichica-D10 TaxID=1188229 RepID=A0A1J0AG86_9CYAN|nr:NAD+ synthase [Gloeomargarita lithophora]APB34950.1 NAD synthetase [Gloeomargarita lithophora Alchichica-D10]